jgi:hypothetical protein
MEGGNPVPGIELTTFIILNWLKIRMLSSLSETNLSSIPSSILINSKYFFEYKHVIDSLHF